MNKKLFVLSIFTISLIFNALNQNTYAEMYVQSLSSGTSDISSNSNISYTNSKMYDYNTEQNNTGQNASEININNYYYYPSSPYYYYGYPTYVIRPYYTSGISIGGYNYKGFGYTYKGGYNYGNTAAAKRAVTVTKPASAVQQPVQSNTKPNTGYNKK